MPHLKLKQSLVQEAHVLAQHIVEPVIEYIGQHTTVAIERTTLRLIGVDGVDTDDIPLPNRIVDSASLLLQGGILRPFVATMLQNNLDVQATAAAIGRGELSLHEVQNESEFRTTVDAEALRLVREGVARVRARRAERAAMVQALRNPPTPWLYVIVATGNIYEDIVQAQAAARQGADVIAVIRSTAQSLLD
ncbi:MAG TPA: lysine 5,6-aminomutase subunit alpha, partial [Ktedonobacteraceae bacterium]|nr:lysine 5,6-aminomutase subunit alpha [Ktedonobacteraceae bacterium]